MMGRIPVGSRGSKDSMSTLKGKGSQKLGVPINNLNEKTVKTVAENLSTKGVLREAPIEIFPTSTAQSRLRANLKVDKGEDAGKVRAPSVYESARLCSKFQAGPPKEPERRKKVCNRSHVQKDKNVQGATGNLKSDRFKSKEKAGLDDYTLKKRIVVDDVAVAYARKSSEQKPESSGDTTGFSGHGEETFQERASDSGLADWTALGKWSMIESRDAVLRKETLHSPSGSDSSSSISTFETSSLSCKSEVSSFAKGDLSPSSVAAKELKSSYPSNVSLGPGIPPISAAESLVKRDVPEVMPECNHKHPMPIHKRVNKKHVIEGDFLEYKFLEGKMVESQLFGKNSQGSQNFSSGYLGYLNNDSASLGENPRLSASDHDLASMDLPDEEWTDGLTTPAFYSATARSPETCSETSYHSGDAIYHQAIDQEFFKQLQLSALVDQLQGSVAGARNIGDDWDNKFYDADFTQVEASLEKGQDAIPKASATSRKPSSTIRLPKGDLEFQSAPFEADIDVDRVLLKAQAQASRNLSTRVSGNLLAESSDFTKGYSLYQCSNRIEDGFSFQPAPLHSGVKQNESFGNGCTKASAPSSHHKGSLGGKQAPADCRNEVGLVSLPHKSNSMRSFLKGDFGDQLQDNHQISCKATNSFPVSPTHSFHETKPTERPDNTPVKARVDSLWPGTSKLQPATLPSTRIPWDWRSKSLGARASLRSAVRNLEAAFVGSSRSVSTPKTRAQAVQKDPKPDGSRLLDRVSVSPVRGRQNLAEILKPSLRSGHLEIPPSRGLQENENARSGLSWRRDAKSLLSPKKSLSMCSQSTLPYAVGNPVIRSMPTISHRHTSSELEILCKPFLPASKSIRCLPAPKGALGPEKLSSAIFRQSVLKDTAPLNMLQGYLQCILKDGIPCYTLTMDDSEEVLLARAYVLENHSSKEGYKCMYTFHSGRSKAKEKGKGGWRSWRRKDKPASDLAGKMKVSSVLCPEVAPSGEIKHSIVSEFVLFDGRAEDAARSQSLRLWSSDVARHNRPSTGSMSDTLSSMSNAASNAVSPPSISRQQTSQKLVSRSLSNVNAGREAMSTQPQISSPVKATMGHRPSFSLDVWSDTDLTDPEVRPLSPCPSHMELAAMVIQVPAEEQDLGSKTGSCHARKEIWGWGLKFLEKHSDSCSELEARRGAFAVSRTVSLGAAQCDRIVKCGSVPADEVANVGQPHGGFRSLSLVSSLVQQSLEEGSANKHVLNEDDRSGGLDTNKFTDSTGPETIDGKGLHVKLPGPESVTIILPAADHGLPTCESSGPSPLIERWRSGGKCDCGGWDLGCGLTILGTERSNMYNMGENMESARTNTNTIQSLAPNKPLSIFSQSNKQVVILSLAVVQQGLFMLTFQAQVSPLRAFATAVAILHSKESLPSAETWITMDKLNWRPPRAPPTQSVTLSRASSRSEEDAAALFSELYTEFPARCPSDPPLSPFGRV